VEGNIDYWPNRDHDQPMTGATVGRLWHYPVKSMQGEEVEEILLGSSGVAGDRAYGFLDVETGRLASAKRPKRFGALLDCHARFSPASGRYPQSPPRSDAPPPPIEVTFPDGTVVRGDDAELTRRVTELLGREVRLISTAPDGLTFDELWPQIEGLGPDAFVDALESEPADSQGDRVMQIPAAMAAPGTMLDLAALHILAANTLNRLKAEHPTGEWDPRRMRPNMLIDAGDEPADEDDWLGCDLHLGAEAIIHVVGPTPRCVMTTLAQPGLPKDPGVLKTIAGVGRKQIGPLGQFACAGSYAEVVTPGVVYRGDQVRIERVQPRQGALAATIDVMAAALAAGS
jgi:uncharacterized protein